MHEYLLSRRRGAETQSYKDKKTTNHEVTKRHEDTKE